MATELARAIEQNEGRLRGSEVYAVVWRVQDYLSSDERRALLRYPGMGPLHSGDWKDAEPKSGAL